MGTLGIFVLGVTAIYFGPEYAGWESRIWTAVGFCVVLALSKTPSSRNLLTGNSKSFLVETPYVLIRGWLKDFPNEGLLRYYIVGNLEWVMPTSPEALKEILVTKAYEFEKPEIMKYGLQKTLGHGILLAEGEEHKIHRKNLMPAFSYRHIKNLYSVFWSKSVEMVKMIEQDLLSRTGEDNVVRIGDWASRITLDIIGVAGMGCDFDALKSPEYTLHQSYKTLVSQTLSEKLLFLLGVLTHPRYTLNLPTARNREMKMCNARIRSAAREVIQQRKAKKTNIETDIDIISVALQSGLFDEESLIDQAMTFLGAGHDTTAASLQWSIYALCKHPDIQTNLREEVRAHLPAISGSDTEHVSASTLDNLPYLSAFCNEVLRFYPAVPKTVRRAVHDTTVIDKRIPEGTLIVLAPEVINHMDEMWGPDADKFDLQRFLKPGQANVGGATSNFANMSFLHGPRSCIARGFAKAELAFMVAAMAGRFQMELKYPDAELRTHETLTLVPADGVLAILTPLDGW
ncbi:hypothetical protein N7532_004792 [Penicillium argentinense]|uniref:Cytochrome P450 n=1 Tax=Penicillium argentinense TaxID=1131581 RepID=A0A9W9KFZ5_9EURO|nr:uncharacterized protein N7532_004792 [Penicillium argentinense]KAJ5104263.1 hypothetical protein N7532_004792 [Penicillium argentinense]